MFEYRFIGSVINELIDQAIDIFGRDIEPSEKEVWNVIRGSSEPPDDAEVTNIFINMFFHNLADKLWEIDNSLEFDWGLNCESSYFNYRFDTFEDFKPLEDLYDFVENLN